MAIKKKTTIKMTTPVETIYVDWSRYLYIFNLIFSFTDVYASFGNYQFSCFLRISFRFFLSKFRRMKSIIMDTFDKVLCLRVHSTKETKRPVMRINNSMLKFEISISMCTTRAFLWQVASSHNVRGGKFAAGFEDCLLVLSGSCWSHQRRARPYSKWLHGQLTTICM